MAAEGVAAFKVLLLLLLSVVVDPVVVVVDVEVVLDVVAAVTVGVVPFCGALSAMLHEVEAALACDRVEGLWRWCVTWLVYASAEYSFTRYVVSPCVRATSFAFCVNCSAEGRPDCFGGCCDGGV